MGLMGWDDAPLAAHTHPPLTTLHAPRQQFGAQLAHLLAASIEGKAIEQHHVTLPMKLVVRKSTTRR